MDSKPKFDYGTNPTPFEKVFEKDRETLHIKTKVGYGAGHVFNDMLTVIDPGFLLIFLKYVIRLPNFNAGIVVVLGQISNSMSTALIGIIIDGDKNFRIYNYYSKRKTWHLIGTICVIISFPFLCLTPIAFGMSNCAFQSLEVNVSQSQDGKIPNSNFSTECMFDDKLNEVTLYYTVINVLQNFGWAAVQKSHLSIIPHLATLDENQSTLNYIRNAATTASFIFIYCIVGQFFKTGNNLEDQNNDELQGAFQKIMIVIVSVGALCSYLFHQLVKENDKSLSMTDDERHLVRLQSIRSSRKMSRPFISIMSVSQYPDIIHEMKIYQWLLEPQFYLISLNYMTTRLFFQIALLYTPFFVNKTLKLPNEYMASVPLAMYIAGLIFSGFTKHLSDRLGVKKPFVLFCGIGFLGCLWILFGCNNTAYDGYEVFLIAITMGAASSSMLILSATMIDTFIGFNIGKYKNNDLRIQN